MNASKAPIVTTGTPGCSYPGADGAAETLGESPKSLDSASPSSLINALLSIESTSTCTGSAAEPRVLRISGPELLAIGGSGSVDDKHFRRSLHNNEMDYEQVQHCSLASASQQESADLDPAGPPESLEFRFAPQPEASLLMGSRKLQCQRCPVHIVVTQDRTAKGLPKVRKNALREVEVQYPRHCRLYIYIVHCAFL